MSSSSSRQQLEAWLKTLNVSGRVADVGGAQLPVKGRTKTWGVSEYEIYDLDHPHEIRKNLQSFRSINLELPWSNHDKQYDVVFCLEVFEYVLDPVCAMNNLASLLRSGGALYASFTFVYPHHNPAGKDYLRYTRWAIGELCRRSRLEPRKIIGRTTESGGLYALYAKNGMRATTGINHEETGYLLEATKV